MILHDLLLLVADCSTMINLTDKKGRTIWFRVKMDFLTTYDNFKVNYIDLYYDISMDATALEINIDYEVSTNGK